MTEPVTAEQLRLPLIWTAPHTHPYLEGRQHQHFDDHNGDMHVGVPLVPFEPAAASYDQQVVALDHLRIANQTKHAGLARQGIQIQPMGIQLMRIQAQLDTVLRRLLTPGELVEFELAFEGQVAAALGQVEQAAPGMKLQAPMPPAGPNGQLFMPPGFRGN